ncbi:Retrovirus-related Pol polyprotein from transposon RE2 [Fagus crenata]
MTFDSNDFSHITPPRRSHVANANGVTYPVTGAGIVTLSPSLSLSHTLLVPSLSNKLMSDILTKEIIGRGTKKGGLYYVDDFCPGRANHMHHTGELRDEEQNWWGSEELHVEDNPAHMNDGNDMIEPDVQTVLGVDMYPRAEPVSLANAESEDESTHSSVPDPDDPPSENIPETQSWKATKSILSGHRRKTI